VFGEWGLIDGAGKQVLARLYR